MQMTGDVFQALSDPTRRKILEFLRWGERSAGEIAAQFSTTDATVSHHLAVLRRAELILSARRGQHIYYCLNTTVFQDILLWLTKISGGDDEN